MPTISRARQRGKLLLLAAVIMGCTAGAPSTPVAMSPAAVDRPTPSPTEAASASTAASPSLAANPTPLPIDPGDVDPEPPLELVWEARDPSGEAVPFHPAIDLEGRIWVGAMGENRFLIFDRDGEFIESWGTAGSEQGQFRFMPGPFGGVAFASDGSFYVSDSANRRIQKFDRDREFVTSWGSFGSGDDQFLVPNEIAIDAKDNVYVHDDELFVTKMFTSDGEFVRTFAEGSGPFVSVTAEGHVLAQMWETNFLHEYAPDGSLLRSIDLNGLVAVPRAGGVVVDDDGDIWISSVTEDGARDVADKLIELNEDGELVHRWDGMAVTQFVIDPAADRLYAAFGAHPVLSAYAIPGD
jgi:hypothetical protein